MERIDNKKALFNEIANLYLLHSYDLDSAISYYNKALQTDSTIDYVYYNIALAYTAKNAVRDSMIYYKSKAIDYNPYRWQKYISEVADFYWSKNDTTNTIKYNSLLLKFKPHTTFDAYFEEEKLIKILLARKKFADAEKILEQYVDPKLNFYQRLSEIIKKADGYAAYLSGKIK
jgi:tetratricopeptide (TPR) repeat protein